MVTADAPDVCCLLLCVGFCVFETLSGKKINKKRDSCRRTLVAFFLSVCDAHSSALTNRLLPPAGFSSFSLLSLISSQQKRAGVCTFSRVAGLAPVASVVWHATMPGVLGESSHRQSHTHGRETLAYTHTHTHNGVEQEESPLPSLFLFSLAHTRAAKSSCHQKCREVAILHLVPEESI